MFERMGTGRNYTNSGDLVPHISKNYPSLLHPLICLLFRIQFAMECIEDCDSRHSEQTHRDPLLI